MMEEKPKILVVDDKHENLVAIQVVLKDLEVELVMVNNGNDALKATLHHDFALALLDIQMPEMDGFELAAILREDEKTAQLPFIFISAVYTDNFYVFKGYESGAFSFITKPFQPEILINKIKFFIEKHQHEIALRKLNNDLELKNTELELLNNDMESFSYSVSHDLRAPLRAINGFAKILEENLGEQQLNEEDERLMKSIRANVHKMETLIDDLLSFSRLGRSELVKSPVVMNDLIQSVIDEIRHTQTHRAVISVGDLPVIQCDEMLMRQVMVNLVSNAVKYSSKKEHPQVSITADKKEKEYLFSVRDNGAGFNMDYADRLFNVFQRLHSEKEFSGTGVGLAIVQKIISRHNGKVYAEGKPNEGATFYFTIPA